MSPEEARLRIPVPDDGWGDSHPRDPSDFRRCMGLLGGVRSVARLSGPSFVGAVMGPIVGDDLDALLAEVRLALPAVAK